jgi:hypothetical protein
MFLWKGVFRLCQTSKGFMAHTHTIKKKKKVCYSSACKQEINKTCESGGGKIGISVHFPLL